VQTTTNQLQLRTEPARRYVLLLPRRMCVCFTYFVIRSGAD
jgi:hypothetical protein